MNIQISGPQQLRRSVGHNRLFSELTKKKKTNQLKQQKMVCTKDTQKSQQIYMFNLQGFESHLKNKISQFKVSKANQISQIALEGDIAVKSIMRRIRTRLQKQLFEYVQKTIEQMDVYEQKSAEKNIRSPKQLGSTIEHTFTPKSIQTPVFEFDSQQGAQKINQFSVRSNEFTLGNHKQMQSYNQKVNNERGRTVSEFNVTSRNPTSKKIKDKIMNSRRNHIL